MSSSFTVAVGQFAPVPGQPEENARVAVGLAQRAAALGAGFLLLPEVIITGHDVQGGDLAPTAIPLDHPAVDTLRSAAGDTGVAVCFGMLERTDEGLYVTQPVAVPDGSLPYQRKGCEPNHPDWLVDEERTIIEVGPLRIGIIICADSGKPELFAKVAAGGANLICHPSAGYAWWASEKDDVGDEKLDEFAAQAHRSIRAAQQHAREMGVAYLVSNPVGLSDTVWWCGNSGIVGRDGVVRAWLPGEVFVERMAPGVVAAQVELGPQRGAR